MHCEDQAQLTRPGGSRFPQTPVFPFSAVVGQKNMKEALLLVLVHPGLGGLLIRGERGTAKSTAVRGLLNLLPPVPLVADCPFRCHPEDPDLMCDLCLERKRIGEVLPRIEGATRLVNLPLGTTEDRLLGTLDLEAALRKGERRFQPGLLAQANRSLLYVDEVNLLGDHLVDLLLDVAALGINYVEREGISFRHPSRFILIGSMNPEEGELRPQLLDRFGLCVEVKGSPDIRERIEIARRRLAYESDPKGTMKAWAAQEKELAETAFQAREDLKQVAVPDSIYNLAARFSLSYQTEGHRSDLTMIKAAQAICALKRAPEITPQELVEAAEMVLPHRLKEAALRPMEVSHKKLKELLEDFQKEGVAPSAPPPEEVKKNSKTH